jgi:fructosamine-3-kinase
MDFSGLHLDHLQFLEGALFECLGTETTVRDYFFLSGGCVNQAVQVICAAGEFFVKWNETTGVEMFACEAWGLNLLRQAGEIGVPEVLGYGQYGQRAYLVMEFFPAVQPRSDYWEKLGEAMARLHRHTQPQFGLDYSNFIGSLVQNNSPLGNGIDFFTERRIKAQAGLALYNHAMPRDLYDRFLKLCDRLPDLLPSEPPALLHGDLWNGNVLPGPGGHARLIDPAVHYGLREAEIAFTQLFGGFETDFYSAYTENFPLQPGFSQRAELYNLYPLLVHTNLFGAGYLAGVERVVKKYVG